MGEYSVARPARLITLSREDARQLFAEGDPVGRWNVLMAQQERCAEEGPQACGRPLQHCSSLRLVEDLGAEPKMYENIWFLSIRVRIPMKTYGF